MHRIVHSIQTRHYIDIHLALHVPELTRLIRNVAIVLYFEPFETIRLSRMATAFGWTVDELEREVVGLIQMGKIMGRVDSQNKVRFRIYLGTHTVWEILAKHRHGSLDFGR